MTLDEYFSEWARRPFAWGRTDCVQFAAGWVRECRGTDYAAGYAYQDEQGAAQVMAAADGLEALVTRHLGPLNRDRRGIARGDVILSAFDRGPTLGIAVGPRAFLLRTPRGLIPVQAELAIGYWPCLLLSSEPSPT